MNHFEIPLETSASRLCRRPAFCSSDLQPLVEGLILQERPPIVVFGKPCHQNRNVGFFSDESVGYRYSGQMMESKPMEPFLKDLLREVNSTLNTDFNGVLVNHYPSGLNSIGAHSDDEKGLASSGIVAMISFGAVRKFRIRNKSDNAIVIDVPTIPFDLLTMEGNFQKEFTHEVPVEKKVCEPRWSLTFRKHVV